MEKLPSEDSMMKSGYVDNAMLLYDEPRELNFTFAYDSHIMGPCYRDISERAEAYRKITPERLREVAREIFSPENLTLTVKGNKRRIDRERLLQIVSAL